VRILPHVLIVNLWLVSILGSNSVLSASADSSEKVFIARTKGPVVQSYTDLKPFSDEGYKGYHATFIFETIGQQPTVVARFGGQITCSVVDGLPMEEVGISLCDDKTFELVEAFPAYGKPKNGLHSIYINLWQKICNH
jgi:hypothetical protein